MLRIAMKQRDRLQYTEKKTSERKCFQQQFIVLRKTAIIFAIVAAFSANECNAM
jgi:fatty acid desaturase